MDTEILTEKAIKRIADIYGFDVVDIKKAIAGSDSPLDLPRMIEEGVYCFRGPDDEVRYENAAMCLSNKILANPGVARVLLPIIWSRAQQWDREDISELFTHIRNVVSIMELNPDCYAGQDTCMIDTSSLPSEKIPLDITKEQRIWAMDKKGMCLTGTDADRIVNIKELYNKNNTI